MSEMMERVARALCRRMLPDSTGRFVDEHWPEYAHLARAAIEAMRETNLATASAGQDFCQGRADVLPGFPFGALYRAMIDAALKD